VPTVDDRPADPQPTPATLAIAEPTDHAAIAALITAVYIGEGYSRPERAERFADVAGWAENATVIVARTRVGGPIVGVVGIVPGGEGHTHFAERGETEMQRLAVAPNARGRGIGRALVADCIARSRAIGATRLVLWTQPVMLSAQLLYEAAGFRRRPDREPVQGRPQLVYVLDLS
jgi:ribosomal protein S18 acetylase RimI-like enzyme